jgi:hypothetical protein
MRWLLGATAVALLLAFVPVSAAHGELFAGEALDKTFCGLPQLRQTIVYIDDMMMIDGQTAWAMQLAIKLRQTLASGERVTVVRLSPASGLSREVWSGCWPAYPAEVAARYRAETYVLTRNPLDRVATQQRTFLREFGMALTRLYADAKRPEVAVHFTPASAPTKQILRALASDDGRFTQSKTTLRAIIYSDMAENSDLGAAMKPSAAAASALGAKLGVTLRRSVIYGFGVGSDLDGSPAFADCARLFWGAAIRSMASTLGGLDADLNLPDIVPARAFSSPIDLDLDGLTLTGRLSLLTDLEGNLVDSWIGVSRLSSTTLTGTYLCRQSSNQPSACQLNAVTTAGVTTRTPGETLTLAGDQATGLRGHLGVTGTKAMFELHTAPDGS